MKKSMLIAVSTVIAASPAVAVVSCGFRKSGGNNDSSSRGSTSGRGGVGVDTGDTNGWNPPTNTDGWTAPSFTTPWTTIQPSSIANNVQLPTNNLQTQSQQTTNNPLVSAGSSLPNNQPSQPVINNVASSQSVVNAVDPNSIDYENTTADRSGATPTSLQGASIVELSTLLRVTDESPFDIANKANNFNNGNGKRSLMSVQPNITNFVAPASNPVRDYSSSWLDKPDALPTILHSTSRGIRDTTFSGVAVAAADKLVAEMNKDPNAAWHTIGEPMIDAVNAVRYAIMKSADGDFVPRNILSHFASEANHDSYFNVMKNSKSQSTYGQSAREDINVWFSGQIKIPVIVFASTSSTGSSDKNTYRANAYTADLLSLMEPLRISKQLMGWTQYRANQVEFLNKWDGHQWRNSNQTIANGPTTLSVSLTPNLAKPAIWTPQSSDNAANVWGSESYVNYISATEKSVAAAAASKIGETNFYTALASAVDTLYDETDGDSSAGHRSGLYCPEWDSAGYSFSITTPTFANLDSIYGANANGTTNPLQGLTPMLFFHAQNQFDWNKNPVFKETHAGVPEVEIKPYNILGNGTILGSLVGYESNDTLDKFINVK